MSSRCGQILDHNLSVVVAQIVCFNSFKSMGRLVMILIEKVVKVCEGWWRADDFEGATHLCRSSGPVVLVDCLDPGQRWATKIGIFLVATDCAAASCGGCRCLRRVDAHPPRSNRPKRRANFIDRISVENCSSCDLHLNGRWAHFNFFFNLMLPVFQTVKICHWSVWFARWICAFGRLAGNLK